MKHLLVVLAVLIVSLSSCVLNMEHSHPIVITSRFNGFQEGGPSITLLASKLKGEIDETHQGEIYYTTPDLQSNSQGPCNTTGKEAWR